MKQFTLILSIPVIAATYVRRVFANTAQECYNHFNFRGNALRCSLVFEGFPTIDGEENLDFHSQQRLEPIQLKDIDPSDY